ncbi:hypothetical protein [Nocardioides mangrovi]|uniref:SLAC1 family transporter n=1 Tax=Nocardioides mangrovi TaxID=2874580 RepID=UPI0021E11385|nr:hypothetical protein [Nocardioides mangrovi]
MAGRVPLNAFGIAFGTAGLAGTWGAAADAGLVPRVVSDIVWVAAAAALGLVAVRYVQGVGDVRTAVDDLRHPVLGPFAALVPATGMLLGARLLRVDRTAGEVVVLTGAVVAAVFGCWFLTGLLAGDRPLVTVHPGYLLPTTAAPLIGARRTPSQAGGRPRWPRSGSACSAGA